MAKYSALTTVDNPYNPFTEWDKWYNYDYYEKGYDTCGYLARVAPSQGEVPDEFYDKLLQLYLEEIVENDVLHRYKIVYSD